MADARSVATSASARPEDASPKPAPAEASAAIPWFPAARDTGRRGSAKLEYANLPAGGTLTLLNLTKGPGHVSHLWVAINCPDPLARERTEYRIYVDGEATPSVRSTLVGFHAADATPNTNFATRYIGYSHDGFSDSYYAYLPIPFRSSIKIDLVNGSSSAAATVFAIADYHTGLAQAWGRMGRLHTFEQEVSVAAYAWQGLVSLVEQSSGTLWGVYLRMIGGDANFHFLEGNVQFYLDGSPTPNYESSGTEDYFNNAWYFQTGVIFAEHSGCTRYDDVGHVVGAYRFHVEDPVPFDHALRARWQNGTADQATVVNPTGLRSHVWYYTAT
ncbi:MAG: DUF2961 domain-containing protein [Chloroflexota bacterium]